MMRVDRILQYLLVFGLFLAGIYLFSTYQIVPLNRDAGYYIPVAGEVMNGSTPTVDVNTSYSPFLYYVYALWMGIFGMETERLFLLVYLVNVFNGALLFAVIMRFIESKMLGVVIAISYFFTVMVCQGYTIVHEPFQVAFVLLAFLMLKSRIRTPWRYFLTGLSLGVSIMFKQYSVLVLIGFLGAIAADDLLHRSKVGSIIGAWISVVIGSVIPFLMFIALTDAEMINTLQALGFLGGKAISYSTAENITVIDRLWNVTIKMVHLNWLFLPPLIYAVLLFLGQRHKASLKTDVQVLTILVFSAVPILIRQFGHYFLLIAPWSYTAAAIVLGSVLDENHARGKRNMGLLIVISMIAFIIVPLLVSLSPSFWNISKMSQTMFIAAFILAVVSLLFIWLFQHRRYLNVQAWILVILIAFGFETLFLSMKIPFADLKKDKEAQIERANKVGMVLERGSEVLVVDDPVLYVLCDYTNPTHDYSFIKPRNIMKRLSPENLAKTSHVIVNQQNHVVSSGLFEENGFQRVGNIPGTNLVFFSRMDTSI